MKERERRAATCERRYAILNAECAKHMLRAPTERQARAYLAESRCGFMDFNIEPALTQCQSRDQSAQPRADD